MHEGRGDRPVGKGGAAQGVEDAVIQVVADVQACVGGKLRGQADGADRLGHGLHRQGREEGVLPAGDHGLALRTVPRIVGDAPPSDVPGDQLRGDGFPAPGLAQQ